MMKIRKLMILLTVSNILFYSCATKKTTGEISDSEIKKVISNVDIERYSYLLGDIVSKEGNDGMYKAKILCKTKCPTNEKRLTDFSYRFYKVYCLYNGGKPLTKEEIVKLPEKLKNSDIYWRKIIWGIEDLDYPEYYKNKYIEKARKKELPVLLPVSKIYDIYTDMNCYIRGKSLYYFVKPAKINPETYDRYVNLNYIKMGELVGIYAQKLIDKVDMDISEEIERDRETTVWAPNINSVVRSDGLVLKDFIAKKDLDKRISIQFTLENPTGKEKIFNLTSLVFYKDGQEYPVVYISDKSGEIKDITIEGKGCERKNGNKLIVKPHSSCKITYGGKLWAKGIIIPGVEDLDEGTINIDGFKLSLNKTTLFKYNASRK